MTWGAYWLYYKCPECGKKFKYSLELISDPDFGKCPECSTEGTFVCETRDRPADSDDYEDV